MNFEKIAVSGARTRATEGGSATTTRFDILFESMVKNFFLFFLFKMNDFNHYF